MQSLWASGGYVVGSRRELAWNQEIQAAYCCLSFLSTGAHNKLYLTEESPVE